MIKRNNLIHLWMKKKINNYPDMIIYSDLSQNDFLKEYIEKCLDEYSSFSSFTIKGNFFKEE